MIFSSFTAGAPDRVRVERDEPRGGAGGGEAAAAGGRAVRLQGGDGEGQPGPGERTT